jgi:hypothetical protein
VDRSSAGPWSVHIVDPRRDGYGGDQERDDCPARTGGPGDRAGRVRLEQPVRRARPSRDDRSGAHRDDRISLLRRSLPRLSLPAIRERPRPASPASSALAMGVWTSCRSSPGDSSTPSSRRWSRLPRSPWCSHVANEDMGYAGHPEPGPPSRPCDGAASPQERRLEKANASGPVAPAESNRPDATIGGWTETSTSSANRPADST